MDLDDIKRGLRAEIKKRENEQYATFQCNVRQMCKDVLAKLEEQESEIAELKADYKEACDRLQTANLIKDEQLAATRHSNHKRCLAMAGWCNDRYILDDCLYELGKTRFYERWEKRWLELAEKFKEDV